MDLLFSSASLLGLNYEFEFIGENFNFRNRKDLSIEGEILALTNYSGVQPIWSGISGVISTQTDYKEIILNGVSFGSGKLNSISFDAGIDVRRKKYSASISIYSTGNFSNLYQSGYSGLYTGFQAQDVRNIESLDETFDFQKNNDGTFTYNRQLNFNLQSGKTSGDLVTLHTQAKSIANLIFKSDVSFPFLNSQYPALYTQSGKKIYTENYDLLNSNYSFSESFTFQDQDNFSWVYDISLNTDENGETRVTEKGRIKNVDNRGSDSSAKDAFDLYQADIFHRCEAVYTGYYGTGCTLKEVELSSEFTRDQFAGEISYSIIFTNNEKTLGNNTGVFWDKTYSCENSNGVYFVSERGTIIGFDIGVVNSGYVNAFNFYSGVVLGGISSRSSAYFSNTMSGLGLSCSKSLLLDSKSVIDSEFERKIEYSFNYSTDSRLNTGAYTFLETNISNSLSTPLYNNIAILGDNSSEYAIGVYRGNSSLGNYKFSINMIGATNYDVNTLLNSAKSNVSKELIPSAEYYLKDASYSYDFNNKKFSLDTSFDYVSFRDLNNITI